MQRYGSLQKVGEIDQASYVAMGAEYRLIFGHDPLVFDYLSAARDRAKEPPPETVTVAEVAADPVEEPNTAETPDEEP